MNKEEIYTFNEYVLGYDKGNNDRSCLTISKIQNGNIYVMSSLYDGSADVISMILDNLQKENKQLKNNWNKLKEIVKSQSDFKLKCHNESLWFEVDELLNKMQELEKGDE